MIPADALSVIQSAPVRGVGTMLTILIALGAVYKFFIEFVEPNEEAIRTRNNKPDYRRMPIRPARRIAYILEAMMLILVFIVTRTIDVNGFAMLGVVAVVLVGVVITTATWPKSDEYALVGPGIKIKVPGWYNYKRGVVALDKRTTTQTGLTDQTHQLIDVEAAYTWHRARKDGPGLWRSLVGVDDLLLAIDTVISVSVQLQVATIDHADRLSRASMEELGEQILADCKATCYAELGVALVSVKIAKVGATPQGAIAEAIKTHGNVIPAVGALFAAEK